MLLLFCALSLLGLPSTVAKVIQLSQVKPCLSSLKIIYFFPISLSESQSPNKALQDPLSHLSFPYTKSAASSQSLKHHRPAPASGPLHLLFSRSSPDILQAYSFSPSDPWGLLLENESLLYNFFSCYYHLPIFCMFYSVFCLLSVSCTRI